MRLPGAVAVLGALGLVAIAGCSSNDNADTGNEPARTLLALPDSQPGDVIALRAADGGTVEWIDRRAGTIRAVAIGDPSAIETLATIEVGIEGEQRGLLGHTLIDGVRYAAWTDPTTNHLLVGEVGSAGAGRIVWDGGGTAGGAVGGHLEASDAGQLILGIGQLTDWAKRHGSGAMVQLDPAGPVDQEPMILSDGYTNPFAFAVIDGELWVADNAVGDDVERIGRGDLLDLDEHATSALDPRAPSALVSLPDNAATDGHLAICGFLDALLRAWSPDDNAYGDSLGPCLTGAAALPDGSIVTATADGLVLLPPLR